MHLLPRPLLVAILLSLGLHAFLLTSQQWLPSVSLPGLDESVLEMVLSPAAEISPQPVPEATPQAKPPAWPVTENAAAAAAARPLQEEVPAVDRLAASEALAARPASAVIAARPDPVPQAAIGAVLASAPAAESPAADEGQGEGADAQLLLASRLPQQARIDYALFAYGTRLGTGRMQWQQTGGSYRLSVELSPLIGPGLTYESRGRVLAKGLQPESFAATRNGKAREWAKFDWQAGLLRYGEGEEKTVALQGGAVDWLSLSFDLASRGLGSRALARQITTGKKVYAFSVLPKGQDEFDPKHEEGQAQIVQARKDKEVIEIWLAPAFANLPVRISKQDEDRTLSLRASRIEINGTVAWRLP